MITQQVSHNDKMKSKRDGGVHSETFERQRQVWREDAEMKCARWRWPRLWGLSTTSPSCNIPGCVEIRVQWMSCILLLVRTASIKAFAVTPKIIHILLDFVKRERTDGETVRKAGCWGPRRASLCSNVAAGVLEIFFSDIGNSCEKQICREASNCTVS